MIEVDIELVQGSFVLTAAIRIEARTAALFGPSGAGKTTILDAIAGLRTPRRGSIAIAGRVLFSSGQGVNLPPHQRHVGYVPQDVALFPHMDVRRNLLYGRHPGVSPDLELIHPPAYAGPLLEAEHSAGSPLHRPARPKSRPGSNSSPRTPT